MEINYALIGKRIRESLFYLIPNSSSAPSATLYMNTHSKYLLLPDTLSCKQIQCDI